VEVAEVRVEFREGKASECGAVHVFTATCATTCSATDYLPLYRLHLRGEKSEIKTGALTSLVVRASVFWIDEHFIDSLLTRAV